MILVFLPAVLAAETDWLMCGPTVIRAEEDGSVDPDSPIDVTSDVAIYNEASGKAELSGNVEVVRGGQRLFADEVHYSEQERTVQARGGVTFSGSGLTVKGPDAEVHLDDDTAEFSQASYWYSPRHARGRASRVYRKSPQVIELDNATYTTCNPGNYDWLLSADYVKLDRESGQGTARNVLLRFKQVPIIYTPYFVFPIDDRRKTGFLTPKFGTTSNSGLSIAAPFYWNMAPNRDVVITPNWLSDRGLQVRTDFRYLYPFSRGRLNFDYLDDNQRGDNRYLISVEDASFFTPRLTTLIDFKKVSDSNYFEDLGNSLSQTSISHLRQNGEVRYRRGFWNFLTRVEKWQTIDRSINPLNRPYKRLPQFLLQGKLPDQAFGLGYELSTEWVHFVRDTGVVGDRFNTLLGIELPFVRPGFYVKPKARLQFTKYNLSDIEEEFMDESPTRTVPILELDSRLVFERNLGDGHLFQTLEPRLYYLYVPFKDQSDIPKFDTAELDFTFLRLFRYNRFVGGDRVGDANQLTAAFTSRLVNARNGHETLSAKVGQTFYFRDREVTLPTRPIEETNKSDVLGELSFGIGEHWTVRGNTVFDPRESEQKRVNADLRFRAEDNRIVNLGYRFRRDDLNQTEFAMAWPVGRRWHVLSRWNYDLEDGRNLQILGGLEYETCCWKVRFAARRFVSNDDGDFNNTVEVQLVFKGLTALGTGLDDILEREIRGYVAED